MLADGGVAVAHRAFHRWKRPAQRSVVVQGIRSPAYAKGGNSKCVALPAVPGTVGLRQGSIRPASQSADLKLGECSSSADGCNGKEAHTR